MRYALHERSQTGSLWYLKVTNWKFMVPEGHKLEVYGT